MRFTGSLCTTVTHGTSGTGTCSEVGSDSVRSISRGMALTWSMLPPHAPEAQCTRSPPPLKYRQSDEIRGTLDGMTHQASHDAVYGLPVAVPSTALFTDHYELTMLQAALRDGTAHRRSVFEVFTRRLPEGRRYGVVAGTGRVLDA